MDALGTSFAQTLGERAIFQLAAETFQIKNEVFFI